MKSDKSDKLTAGQGFVTVALVFVLAVTALSWLAKDIEKFHRRSTEFSTKPYSRAVIFKGFELQVFKL